MANIDTLNTQLSAVGDAIRAKLSSQDTYKISEMPTAIGSIPSGGGFPTLTFSGDCSNLDREGNWDIIFEDYSNNIQFQDITKLEYGFYNSSLEDLSGITLYFKNNTSVNLSNLFNGCTNLKKLPKIGSVPLQIANCDYVFKNAQHLIDFGDFGDSTKVSFAQGNYGRTQCLSNLYTIRIIPSIWLKDAVETTTIGSFQHLYYNNLNYNYNIDEYNGIGVSPSTFTSNVFNSTFSSSWCCKKITFNTNNGTPYTVQWKGQTITINVVGYVDGGTSAENKYIIPVRGVNKKVYDAASYEALKNDPDWYTLSPAYSRYNHDSAVETINSLPDTSAYIATAGGTNIIKFKGDLGSATDGGAINTLTAEEIAVATNKGWTVTLV